MDEETLKRIMTAALQASQASQTQQVQSLKKPELPPFDKKNIEVWIKRVESAFLRVNCTDPKLKFAHLESKFQVGEDPTVDAYLYGEANQANWDALIAYFKDRYGKTKKQMALSLINGTPREGRTPSQLAAAIDDKAGDVSIDDIKKEQLLRQLPPDIFRQIVDRVDKLSFKETARLADAWFDKDGKPLIGGDASSINQVTFQPTQPSNTSSTPAASAATLDTPSTLYTDFPQQSESTHPSETDVNAIRQHQQGRRPANRFGNSNRGRGGNNRGNGNSNSRGAFNSNTNYNTNSYGNSASYSNAPNNSNRGSSGGKPKNICHFHIKFGPAAERCETWCMLNPAKGKASL